MENVRNRIDFKLIRSEAMAKTYRNTLKRFTVFEKGDDGVGCREMTYFKKK